MAWTDRSRAFLSLETERIKRLLGGATDDAPTPFEEPAPALVVLQRCFGLSGFERDVLVLCAGAVLDPTFHVRPSFGLALSTLREPHFDATSPDAPLRSRRLVSLAAHASVLTAGLAIDDRILHFLLGVDALDERILPLRIPTHTDLGPPTPSQMAAVDRIGAALHRSPEPVAVQVTGSSPTERIAAVCTAADRIEMRPLRLRASALPSTTAELDVLACCCEREHVLGRALPIVELDVLDGHEVVRVTKVFVDRLQCAVVVTGPVAIALSRPFLPVEVPLPDETERRALWTEALGPDAPRLGDTLERIAEQFRIDRIAIAGAALDRDRTTDDEAFRRSLWRTCLERSRPNVDELARRIEPTATWEDLVLSSPTLDTLREIGMHLRHRATVHERWGFARGATRGQSITALFCGSSGTGKTLAAEVIARETGLDLYHVDLSQIVDKYIGETEKRLRRVFDAAEQSAAILLFDEADALFGRRGQIERGADRWANLEVSYLLQRMETYRGLAILTTNSKDAIDSAFLRRLRFVARFPYPDVSLRAELWKRAFPGDAPTAALPHAMLARLQLTGANIKAIALKSAVYAADERRAISMTDVLRAARGEFVKLEVPFPEAEVQTWNLGR